MTYNVQPAIDAVPLGTSADVREIPAFTGIGYGAGFTVRPLPCRDLAAGSLRRSSSFTSRLQCTVQAAWERLHTSYSTEESSAMTQL